jgi:hypothetical protein
MGVDVQMTLVRPERDEELRIEAESQTTAGVQAYSDCADGDAWCIREDPERGPVFVLRRGDYFVSRHAPALTGDVELDVHLAECAWDTLAGRLNRGIPAERQINPRRR